MDQNTAIIPAERPIALTTMDDIIKFAEIALKSKVFPDIENAQQAVVKIMLGRELGIGALASLRGIIFDRRGAITLLANLQGAVAQRAGYTWKVDKLDESACELEFFDPKGKPIGKSSLTMEQAKRGRFDVSWDKDTSGWKPKPAWQSAPRNMLFARCLTNGIKWFCPAVTNGIPLYDPDELTPTDPAGEIIDMVPGKPEPERKPEAQHDNGKQEPKVEPKADTKAEAQADPQTLAEVMAAAQSILNNPPKGKVPEGLESTVIAHWNAVNQAAQAHGIIAQPPAEKARLSEYLHDIVDIGTAVQAAIAEESKKVTA